MSNVAPIPDDEFDAVAPQCRATVEAIQRALDGDGLLPTVDTHLTACAACRERVRAARVLLSVLAMPSEPVAVPAGFAERAAGGMWVAWHERRRRKVRQAVAAVALAASVFVAVAAVAARLTPKSNDVVFLNEPAPLPAVPAPVVPQPPQQAPEPRPVRVSDAIATTGQALRDAPKPLADSVAVAPKVFDLLTDSFRRPDPPKDPMARALEPTRRSLDALPVAARSGLEPVTGTAEKALNRFLRDVGAVKPNS